MMFRCRSFATVPTSTLEERVATLTAQIDKAPEQFPWRPPLLACLAYIVLPLLSSFAASFVAFNGYDSVITFFSKAGPCLMTHFVALHITVIAGLVMSRRIVAPIVSWFWVYVVIGMVVLTYFGLSDGDVFMPFCLRPPVATESIVTSVMRYFRTPIKCADVVSEAAKVLVNIAPRLLFLACTAAYFIVISAVGWTNFRTMMWKLRRQCIQLALKKRAGAADVEDGVNFSPYKDEKSEERLLIVSA
ncbi:uncharacterized protein V1518DRAFT_422376 [Limtongia smithiae]|uniref:uncharacterized protein n=1 Tax=Limtongia smithiae TaxID=1125753 RepID=UPI0034CDA225